MINGEAKVLGISPYGNYSWGCVTIKEKPLEYLIGTVYGKKSSSIFSDITYFSTIVGLELTNISYRHTFFKTYMDWKVVGTKNKIEEFKSRLDEYVQ